MRGLNCLLLTALLATSTLVSSAGSAQATEVSLLAGGGGVLYGGIRSGARAGGGGLFLGVSPLFLGVATEWHPVTLALEGHWSWGGDSEHAIDLHPHLEVDVVCTDKAPKTCWGVGLALPAFSFEHEPPDQNSPTNSGIWNFGVGGGLTTGFTRGQFFLETGGFLKGFRSLSTVNSPGANTSIPANWRLGWEMAVHLGWKKEL